MAGPGLARLCYFVLGRPVLLLQMGHPGMTREEKVPYLASVFAPAPVTLVLGRHADSHPACPRSRAVFHNWREMILPLVLCPDLPPDLLAVVFESDFRLCAEHAVVVRDYEARTAWSWTRGAGGKPGESTQPAGAVHGKKGASTEPAGAGRGQKGGAGARPAPSTTPQTPSLCDLVLLCNQAQKTLGRGDLVWLSWLSSKDKGKLQPARASTCIGLTKAAACRMMEWMQHVDPDHFDVMLANCLRGANTGLEELRDHACFVGPSRGGFQEHMSGCEKKNLLRTEQ